MEAYWIQYREHCLEQVEKFVNALESLQLQRLALTEVDGNPVWIASLNKDIADARRSIEVYQAVIAKLDAREHPTG